MAPIIALSKRIAAASLLSCALLTPSILADELVVYRDDQGNAQAVRATKVQSNLDENNNLVSYTLFTKEGEEIELSPATLISRRRLEAEEIEAKDEQSEQDASSKSTDAPQAKTPDVEVIGEPTEYDILGGVTLWVDRSKLLEESNAADTTDSSAANDNADAGSGSEDDNAEKSDSDQSAAPATADATEGVDGSDSSAEKDPADTSPALRGPLWPLELDGRWETLEGDLKVISKEERGDGSTAYTLRRSKDFSKRTIVKLEHDGFTFYALEHADQYAVLLVEPVHQGMAWLDSKGFKSVVSAKRGPITVGNGKVLEGCVKLQRTVPSYREASPVILEGFCAGAGPVDESFIAYHAPNAEEEASPIEGSEDSADTQASNETDAGKEEDSAGEAVSPAGGDSVSAEDESASDASTADDQVKADATSETEKPNPEDGQPDEDSESTDASENSAEADPTKEDSAEADASKEDAGKEASATDKPSKALPEGDPKKADETSSKPESAKDSDASKRKDEYEPLGKGDAYQPVPRKEK